MKLHIVVCVLELAPEMCVCHSLKFWVDVHVGEGTLCVAVADGGYSSRGWATVCRGLRSMNLQ